MPSLDVVRLHLNFKESKRVDAYGNRFRYRAKLDDARGAKVNRWAWDVYLSAANIRTSGSAKTMPSTTRAPVTMMSALMT